MSQKPIQDLLGFALARVDLEVKDLSETWKSLEAKAQGTAAVAGVFIAAVFVFIRNAGFDLNPGEKFVTSGLLVALVLSIFFAIQTMRGVAVEYQSVAGSSMTRLNRMMGDEAIADVEGEHLALARDAIEDGLDVIDGVYKALGRKATNLALAHTSLGIGAVFLVALAVTAFASERPLHVRPL